jgi:hypothetical protein
MLRTTAVSLLVMITALAGAARAAQPDLGEENYQLPLVGRYGVCRGDARSTPSGDSGMYQLAEDSSPADRAYWSWSTVIPKLEQVAVSGPVIVGKAGHGYFVFDTRQPDPTPRFFDSPESWRPTLRAMGLPGDLQLANPDALAATRPGMVLRPWNYRIVHGLLGYSDEEWSAIVQLVGLAIAFLIGLGWPRGSPAAAAAVLGVVVNIVAHLFIAGGGPGVVLGLLFLPFLYCAAAILGRGCYRLAARRRAQSTVIRSM